MKEEASRTLARQWAMLRAIPRWPQKVTAAQLESALIDHGFKTSRRTIERDLQELSGRFPLVVDHGGKPYGWSWMKNANFEFMPRLTTSQSVALLLAKTHLQSLLPQAMLKDLGPVFDVADRELASSGWKDWHKRTAVVPSTLALLPPKVDPAVLADVQHALARKCCLLGQYRSKGSAESKEMKIHPLGLLVRGSIQYLICTVFDYEDVRQLAVHRLSGTSVTSDARREPIGFNFGTYIADASKFHPRGKIRLIAWFDEAAAEHLRETPLSSDQTWRLLNGSTRVEVVATVEYDEPLVWWLLAFGSLVEVREPAALRHAIKNDLRGAAKQYKDKIEYLE